MDKRMRRGVVAIVKRKNDKGEKEYLLIKSSKNYGKYKKYSDAYYPPGGHLENGENDQEAIIREIKEELGVTAKVVNKITESMVDVSYIIVSWWECELKSNNFRLSQEVKEAKFFTAEQMKKIKLWPATRKFFSEYITI